MQRSSIYSVEHEVLSQMLYELRHSRRLKQAEVAKLIDRPQTYVSAVERGIRALDVIQLLRLLDAYKIDPVDFMTDFRRQLALKKSSKNRKRKS
jgi:transcriptional regulator with XRE-family HTH domain